MGAAALISHLLERWGVVASQSAIMVTSGDGEQGKFYAQIFCVRDGSCFPQCIFALRSYLCGYKQRDDNGEMNMGSCSESFPGKLNKMLTTSAWFSRRADAYCLLTSPKGQ